MGRRDRRVGLQPLMLFLIIFLWTPPHFWALALNRCDDYARAGVPMLPVVAGRAATTWQILIYSGFWLPASELPWGLGFTGAVYGAVVAICGAAFSARVSAEPERRSRSTHRSRLFVFSIVYLFALFAALMIDHDGGLSCHACLAWCRTVLVQAELLPGVDVLRASSFINFSTGEI